MRVISFKFFLIPHRNVLSHTISGSKILIKLYHQKIIYIQVDYANSGHTEKYFFLWIATFLDEWWYVES